MLIHAQASENSDCPGQRGHRAPVGDITPPGPHARHPADVARSPAPRTGPDHGSGWRPGSATISARCRARHIPPAAGDHTALGARRDAGPAGDPGTASSAWSLTITCVSAMTDRDKLSVII